MIRFLVILLLMSTISCSRRPLEETFLHSALIPVKFDWTYSYLNPDIDNENLYNASVWLYSKSGTPFAGKSYMEFSLPTSSGGEIEVPIGVYRVLAFNNSIRSFSSNCGFRGTDNYDTFEYYLHTSTREDGSEGVLEPDLLCVWRSEYFEVTADMVSLSRSSESLITEDRRSAARAGLNQLEDISPVRLTCNVDISVYANRINNSKSAIGIINGMSQSINLWSGKRGNFSSHFFNFESREITKVEDFFGNVRANFRSLGPVSSSTDRYTLDVRFELTSKDEFGNRHYPSLSSIPLSFDLTEQVTASVPSSLWTVVLSIGETPLHPSITLPDVDPGGFSPGVGDWGDEEDIDIPIL